MRTFEFKVPGKPCAKQRPRFTKSGHAYTSEETILYENLVKYCFTEKYPDFVPDEGPVELRISANFPIPESWTKQKKKMAMDWKIYPGKPDWDNVGKAISDALNQIAYKDDSQIHACTVTKRYTDSPCVYVTLILEGGDDDE